MAQDLSLKVAVRLLTQNFNKGVANMKASLRSLSMNFMAFSAALGAGGIGLSNLVSRMREVAKETNSVNIALKNVSGSTAEFADHQKWLLDVANRYGVQINTLTSGFTKFKAAADIAGLSMEDQRKIFESVSRASVAFGLSMEDQRGVFMALSQMMSKGKVMAEELRLQMAERMPVAIQAMAKAAGVTVGEMDAMMKQGKLLSKDVLPKFADALTEMIPNVDLDNLNKSLTDLSNTFVELTKKLNVEGIYKTLVETANSALKTLIGNTKAAGELLLAAIIGWGWSKAIKTFGFFTNSVDAEIAAAKKIADTVEKRTKQVEAAKIRAYNAEVARQKAEVNLANASSAEKANAERALSVARARESQAQLQLKEAQARKEAVLANYTANVQKTAALKSLSAWQRFGYGVSAMLKSAGVALKSFAASHFWTIVLTAITAWIGKIVQFATEARKIKKLVEDTRKELNKDLPAPVERARLESNRNIYENRSGEYSDAQRESALNEINNLLGTEYKLTDLVGKKRDELNSKIARYVKYLQAKQHLENAESVLSQREEEFSEWKTKHPIWKAYRGGVSTEDYYLWKRQEGTTDVEGQLKKFENSISEARQDIVKWQAAVAENAAEFNNTSPVDIAELNDQNPVSSEQSELSKQQEAYASAIAELNTELKNQLITEREYTRKKKDAIEKAYMDALSSGDSDILGSAFFSSLQQEFSAFSHGELRSREEEVEDMLEEYRQALADRLRQFVAGSISEQEYYASVRELATEFYRQAGSLDLEGLSEDLLRRLNLERIAAGVTEKVNRPAYEPRKRDVREWEMTDVDRAAEDLADAEHKYEYLKDLARDAAGSMVDELNAAMANVKSLEEALKLAEAKEAVEELSRELGKGAWEGVKDTVGNVDSIASAFERVNEVMNDTDASEWEKLMAIWDGMVSVVDAFMEVIEMVRTLTEVTEMLAKAKQGEADTDKTTTSQKVENAIEGAAATVGAAAVEKSAAKGVVTANTAVGASEAGKSAAKLPWPLNLVAIGSAIAAALAAFATLPKFAKGGVVGGNSKQGDKVLARLNSGEGVLTEDGMANLAGLAASKSQNVVVSGTLKARGRDLLVVLEQEQRYQQRTR